MVIRNNQCETYIFDDHTKICHRVDWSQPLEVFPKEPLKDIPDIVFQMDSGLYGVKGENGLFDELRYQWVNCKNSPKNL